MIEIEVIGEYLVVSGYVNFSEACYATGTKPPRYPVPAIPMRVVYSDGASQADTNRDL